MKTVLEDLTPKQIVEQLDTYIIGQKKAKRSVAVALRNRTRRLKLPEDIREEIAPKNILMIGPTGVGKTEIARRLAKMCGAPFIKVEATKYTEVGYVGRDVESMVRDLLAVGYNMVREEMQEKMKAAAEQKVEEDLLDLLLPGSGKKHKNTSDENGKQEGGSVMLPFTVFGTNVSEIADAAGSQDKSGASEGFSAHNSTQTSAAAGQGENAGLSASAAGDESAQHAEKEALSSTREKFRRMLREKKLEEREVEVSVKKRQ